MLRLAEDDTLKVDAAAPNSEGFLLLLELSLTTLEISSRNLHASLLLLASVYDGLLRPMLRVEVLAEPTERS